MRKKVLIVDDEPNIVTSLEFLLNNAGYDVKSAHTGDEVLQLVESFAPDAVLLDVMMPSKSGYVVCQEIRGNPAWRHIKVIMLSAKGRESEVDKGLAVGANAYITKPFATKELVARVRDLLGDNP